MKGLFLDQMTESVELGRRIGGGFWRDCYEVAGDPLRCAKVARFHREGFAINVFGRPLFKGVWPAWLALIKDFGCLDPNKYELSRLTKLGAAFKDHTLQNARLARISDGRTAFVADRTMDYDGVPSKTLETLGWVHDAGFWTHMDRLVSVMKETGMHFMDLQTPSNIVVQRISPVEFRPVFIDVKLAGWRGSLPRRLAGRGWSRTLRDAQVDEKLEDLKRRIVQLFRTRGGHEKIVFDADAALFPR